MIVMLSCRVTFHVTLHSGTRKPICVGLAVAAAALASEEKETKQFLLLYSI